MTERRGHLWTEQEDNFLRWHWADLPLEKIADKLGRTFDGVAMRALRLKLGQPRHRGIVTLTAVAEETGWSRLKLSNAAKYLGITPKKPIVANRPRGRKPSPVRVVTEEQAKKILDFLDSRPVRSRIRRQTKGTWNELGRGGFRKPPECIDCGRSDRPHRSRGRCTRCHTALRRRIRREQQSIAQEEGRPSFVGMAEPFRR